jgi:hypothetical protein
MRGLLLLALKHKTIAIVAAAVLSAGGAAAFASQETVLLGPTSGPQQLVGADEPTPTPHDVVEPAPTPVPDDPTATPEPDGDVTSTPEPDNGDATATPEADPDDEDGTGPREVKGIPTTNPVKTDDNGDGVCDKGETVIKTTPSGQQVRVPCQAVDKTHGANLPTPTAAAENGTTAGDQENGKDKTNNGNANGKNKNSS